MKKKLLTLICAIFITASSFATHLMGGEITALHIGGLDYQVTLTAYRDTLGIPMASTATFDIWDNTTGTQINTVSGIPYSNIISGNLLPMYPYGVEVYVFVDTITFPGPGEYAIGWDNCCRNHAIQNLSSPGGESMHLETIVTVPAAPAINSTPFFLVPAAIFLPINTPWQYNPLPFDADGDSLVWSIDAPLDDYGSYCAGYTTPPSGPSNPFSIDPITGTITWTANTLGNFVATVLVDEYRNGVWQGQIRRDMQFIVVQPIGTIPTVTNNLNTGGNNAVSVAANQNFQFQILADDADANTQLFMEAYGELLLPNYPNPASFTTTANGIGNQVEGVFSWSPTNADIRSNDYYTVVRVTDGYYTMDETVLINVSSAVGIEEQANYGIDLIYPNPASDLVYIPFNLNESENLTVGIYDILGSKVKNISNQFASGKTVGVYNIEDLISGQYFVTLEKDGKILNSRKFTVVR